MRSACRGLIGPHIASRCMRTASAPTALAQWQETHGSGSAWALMDDTEQHEWFRGALSISGELGEDSDTLDLSRASAIRHSITGAPIPHTQPRGPSGDVDDITEAPYEWFRSASKQHGEIYCHWKLGTPVVTVSDKDLAADVLSKRWDRIVEGDTFPEVFLHLVNDSIFAVGGQRWRMMRKATGPPVVKGLKGMAPIMVRNSEQLVEDLLSEATAAVGTVEVDICKRLREFQVQNVADVMFSGAFGDQEREHIDTVCRYLDLWIELNKHDWAWHSDFMEFSLAPVEEFKRQTMEVYAILDQAIQHCKEHEGQGMLGSLVSSELSDVEVLKNALSFLAAGSQDAGNGLVHVCYAITEQQDAQAQLRSQLVEYFQGRSPGYGEADKVPYISQVIKESLRMYPHMNIVFPRRSREEMQLRGYIVPPLTSVTVDMTSLHYNEELWEHPMCFDPGRFSPEREALLPGGKRHPCAWLPFGQGARSCLGKAMGNMSLELALATMLQKLELSPTSQFAPNGKGAKGYMDVTFDALPVAVTACN